MRVLQAVSVEMGHGELRVRRFRLGLGYGVSACLLCVSSMCSPLLPTAFTIGAFVANAQESKPLVDEIDIEAMRRELARIRQSSVNLGNKKPGAAGSKAAVVNTDAALNESAPSAQSVREKMLAKEAELLSMLTAPQAGAEAPNDSSTQDVAGANSAEADSVVSTISTSVAKDSPSAAPPPADRPQKTQEKALSGPALLSAKSQEAPSKSSLPAPQPVAATDEASTSERARLTTGSGKEEKLAGVSESARVRALEGSLVTLRKENSTLEQQLSKSKIKQSELANELDEVRNRLMVAERQVELMSARLANRNLETRRNMLGSAPATGPVGSPRVQNIAPAPLAPQRRIPLSQPVDTRPSSDMTVATVVAEKANLRSAPGLNNSPMMTVPRGTTLVVETSQGEWFRVYAPNGTRAWVSGEVLEFMPSAQSAGGAAGGRIKPYAGF